MLFVVNLLIHSWSLICTLSLCTSIDSCAALGNVAKYLVETLKKHMLGHGEMKYLCQVCGHNFPFASDLASHESIHSEEKKFKFTYPKCGKRYKLRLNTITIIITGTNKSQQSHRKLSVRCVTKFSPKSNI